MLSFFCYPSLTRQKRTTYIFSKLKLAAIWQSAWQTLKYSGDCLLCGCGIQPEVDIFPLDSKKASTLICHYCVEYLPFTNNGCHVCGLPLNSALLSDSELLSKETTCGACLKHSPPFDRMVNAFHYEPPISQFISKLKFSGQFELVPLLCDFLLGQLRIQYQHSPLPALILPVPLHNKRQRTRGFNQSHLIANHLSKQLKVDCDTGILKRKKATTAQTALTAEQRLSNLKGAFEVTQTLPSHCALVDDVVTTSATVSELAKTMKKQGASRVDVWSLARAYQV